MNRTSFYIKSSVLLALTFAESLYLVFATQQYVSQQMYLSSQIDLPIIIVIDMALLVITMALSAGAWEDRIFKWLFCLPIPLSIGVGLAKYSIDYILSGVVVSFLLLFLEFRQSIRYKNLLVKFVPGMIVKNLSRGILLIFSIFAALLVYLDQDTLQSINFGQKIAEYTAAPVQEIVDKQISDQLDSQMGAVDLQTLNESNPMVGEFLRSFGITDLNSIDTKELLRSNSVQIDIKKLIENQVNTFIAPYKALIGPVAALLVLSVFYFFGTLAYYLYALLVGVTFYIARKTSLLHTEKIMVEKEVLKF